MVGTRAEQATNRTLWIVISLVALLAIAVFAYLTLRGGSADTSYSPPAETPQNDAATAKAAAAAAQQAQTRAQAAAVQASSAAAEAVQPPSAIANAPAVSDTSDAFTHATAPVNSFTDDYADQTGDTRTASPPAGSSHGGGDNSTGEN